MSKSPVLLVTLLCLAACGPSDGSYCPDADACGDELDCVFGFTQLDESEVEPGEDTCSYQEDGVCHFLCEDPEDPTPCQEYFGSEEALCVNTSCGPNYCIPSDPFAS